MTKRRITVAEGDGIGPEIMAATLSILEHAGAEVTIDKITLGEKVYLSGNTIGIPDEAWELIKHNAVLLKAPITTPQGGGYKSVNVTLRKAFGLYANIRPCKAFFPFVRTNNPDMDLVIIRENEEGLYAGIEHRQTQNTVQCLKLFSHQGCERIVRYAFEYARRFHRRKVTCMSKDNIMKMTDGMFHKIFDEIAKEYPGFETEHQIIDIGTALLASRPERFDVIVTANLYGDILSDVAAQIAGSVGLAGSANIGHEVAMFEAVHGSAPDIAGKKIANPSGLLNAAVLMLIHLDQIDVAAKIQNAWLKTLEEGIHTADIYTEQHSQQRVNTDEFAQAVMANLGQKPSTFAAVSFADGSESLAKNAKKRHPTPTADKALVGVDLFVEQQPEDFHAWCETLAAIEGPLALIAISNRGLKIWPHGPTQCHVSDHWCCRYQASDDYQTTTHAAIMQQMQCLLEAGYDVVKTENLYTFDGERGFSLGQGQ